MPSVPKYFLAVIKYRAGSAWLHRVRRAVGVRDAGQQRFDFRARSLAVGGFVELPMPAMQLLRARRRDPDDFAGDRQASLSSISVNRMNTSSPGRRFAVGTNSPPPLTNGM
jgi:hypothetical protein